MNRRIVSVVVALFALLMLSASAPGGPGDSEPVDPGPHVIVHAPGTVLRTATQCTVWSHDHHMDCGIIGNLAAAGRNLSLISYSLYDMGHGSWDEKFVVNLVPWNLKAGQSILWISNCMDMCEYIYYTGTAVTTVN